MSGLTKLYARLWYSLDCVGFDLRRNAVFEIIGLRPNDQFSAWSVLDRKVELRSRERDLTGFEFFKILELGSV